MRYEFKKLINTKYLIIFIIIIAVKIINLVQTDSESILGDSGLSFNLSNNNKVIYDEYKNIFKGEITDEKMDKIEEEKKQIEQALDKESKAYEKLVDKEITYSEFAENIAELLPLTSKESAFEAFYEDYKILLDDRENRYIINEDNVSMHYEKTEYLLLLFIFVVIAVFFTREQSSKMEFLLKTTENGRIKAALRKTAAACLLVIALWAVFLLIELVEIFIRFGADGLMYPLQSLGRFRYSRFNLSILGTFLLIHGLKLVGYLFFTVLISAFAVLFRNVIATIFTPVSISFIVIYFWGDSMQKYLSPLGLAAANRYFAGDVYALGFLMYEELPYYYLPLALGISAFCIILCIGIILLSYRTCLNSSKFIKYSALAGMLGLCLMLSGCSGDDNEGGTLFVNAQSDLGLEIENNGYIYTTYDKNNDEESDENKIVRTDIKTGESEVITRDFTRGKKNPYNIAFIDNDYIYYFADYSNLIRTSLEDFSSETIYTLKSSNYEVKYFGLYTDVYKSRSIVEIECVFAYGKDVYFIDNSGSLYIINPITKKEKLILSDDVPKNAVSFDGESIYYINNMYQPMKWNLKETSPTIISENYYKNIKIDDENIYLSMDGKTDTIPIR